jgi:Ca2+-binding RTX toxin-like protein
MAEPRFAVDARDRLLMIGQPLQADGVKRSLAVLAIKGSTAGFNAPAGKATLLPGGLLDVAGTSRNDEVRLRRVAGKLEVIINGQSRRFSFANVTGIVIHTGSGNDSIRADVSGMLLGAIIQGGAGKDRISGTNAGDWIDAGDGNDYVDGRSGSDVLNGNAGHDTLRGSEGADLLYGGSGNDTLWSSNDVGIDDSEENFLDGGSGEDAFLTSSHENDYHYRDTVRE